VMSFATARRSATAALAAAMSFATVAPM